MKKLIIPFLCFFMIKVNAQNLRMLYYTQDGITTPMSSFKTSYFDKLFDLVYVNGVLTRNKNFSNPKPMSDIPVTPFDKNDPHFPEVIIINLFSFPIIGLTLDQAQADCLIQYVKDGGILIGNIEQLTITETQGWALEYITKELLCNSVNINQYWQTASTQFQKKFHPDNGILLLNENGADEISTTGSYDVLIGLPSENSIIGDEHNSNISNCNQKQVVEYIIPAYPGLGTNSPNNNCNVKGFAILCGEGAEGIFQRPPVNGQLEKNYIQLIYDFLHDPISMQKRYEWTNIKANNNVNCPPTVPAGYFNAVLTTPIPIPTINTSATILSNTCPELSVNLLSSNIITSNTPTNMELRWFKNKSHYGEQYLTVTAATTGTYYAFYFDVTNNCYSLASNPIKVETTACDPCTINFKNANPTILSGFVGNYTGTHSAGLYWIKSDLTIDNPTSFENAEILIEPNVTINVIGNIATEFKIVSSHLYTCNGRWNGIVASKKSRVIIDGTDDFINNIHTSTLIEDAEIAITQDAEVKDITGDDPLLSINNTIFNRNNIGLKITDPFYYSRGIGFNTGTATKELYNCDIKNTLFTSRNIPFNQGQYDWDNFETISGSHSFLYAVVPSSYAAPYIDDATYWDNVPKAFLKDPINLGAYTTTKPLAGIVLDNLSYVNVNNKKTSVKIGTETQAGDFGQINIFDNLQYGIKANDANFIVTNCSFQKPVGDGIGIYADLNGDNFHYAKQGSNFFNINKVIISKDAGKPANAFFNMNSAITISGYDEVEVKGCEIRSNQDYTNLAQNGKYGITVGSNVFNKIVIEKNNITNIRNAINYGGAAEGGQNYFGILNINNNIIGKEIAVGDMPNGFIENAITASAFVESKYSNTIPLNVKGNIINNAYNGIWLSGWISKNFNVLNNEIHLETDATIAPTAKHYGIKADGGYSADLQYTYATDENGIIILDPQGNPTPIAFGTVGTNLIQDNEIYGAGITPTVGVKPNAGIWLSQQFNTNLGCNKVWASDNAYKFEGLCLLTKFMDNFIYEDNHYGYTLYDGAQIGKQGNEANTTDPDGTVHDNVCVSNNDFNDKNAWIAAQHKMTYTDNSDPLKSPLVIRTGAAYDYRFNPDGVGWAYPPIGTQIYSTSNGIVTTSSSNDGIECDRCNNRPFPRHIKHSLIELMEEIALGTTTIPNDQPFERLEVMQQQLYELVKARPEIAENSSDIQQFIYDNQWSSLDFIYYAGYYASKGNMDMVNTLLNYWTPSNSEQDNNYYTYYEWLVNMYNNPGWKPNIDEVKTMAEKCPIKEGTIIYAARNLYNALTREIHKFDNACDGNNTNARGVKKQIEMIRLKQPKAKPIVATNQIVSIYPNPAKNIINIKGVNAKQIIVVDALGKIVIDQQNLSPFTQQLNIDMLSKGIYLVKIVDSNNKTFTNKFIKE